MSCGAVDGICGAESWRARARRRGVAAARKALIGVGGIARYRRAAGVTRRFAPHPPRLPPNSRNIGHLASGLLPPPPKNRHREHLP